MLRSGSIATATLLIAALASCGGIDYAMKNYSDVPIVQHQANGKTWRVFDKPAERRLMITPTHADAASAGLANGATFGVAGDLNGPQRAYRLAAADFIRRYHPTCAIADGAKILAVQYEFFYNCR